MTGTFFIHRGRAYELPPLPEWPLMALHHIGHGDVAAGLALLLGEVEAQRLLADGFTVRRLQEVIEDAGRAWVADGIATEDSP